MFFVASLSTAILRRRCGGAPLSLALSLSSASFLRTYVRTSLTYARRSFAAESTVSRLQFVSLSQRCATTVSESGWFTNQEENFGQKRERQRIPPLRKTSGELW